MVGRYDVARCGPCGCEPPAPECETLDDSDFTEELTGEWDGFTVSESEAVKHTLVSVEGAEAWVVRATFTFSATAAQTKYVRLIGDMKDGDNYDYVEFRYNQSTGKKIVIGQRIGGTDTVLSSDPYVTTGSGVTTVPVTLELCWKDGKLHGRETSLGTRFTLQANGVSAITGGGRFGVGTGTNWLAASNVTISAISVTYGPAECVDCVESCCAGVPVPLAVELSGNSNVSAPLGLGSWKFCENLTGSMTLPHTGLGDGECKWRLVSTVVIQRFNTSTGLWENHTATLTVTYPGTLGTITFDISYVYLGVGVSTFFTLSFSGTTPPAGCNDWVDWTALVCNKPASGCCCRGSGMVGIEGCTGAAEMSGQMRKA